MRCFGQRKSSARQEISAVTAFPGTPRHDMLDTCVHPAVAERGVGDAPGSAYALTSSRETRGGCTVPVGRAARSIFDLRWVSAEGSVRTLPRGSSTELPEKELSGVVGVTAGRSAADEG